MKDTDITNTLRGSDPHGCGVGDVDLARGFCDASPTGRYEGDPTTEWEMQGDEFVEVERYRAPAEAGQIEATGTFESRHGDAGQYGFVRRPVYRTDIERT